MTINKERIIKLSVKGAASIRTSLEKINCYESYERILAKLIYMSGNGFPNLSDAKVRKSEAPLSDLRKQTSEYFANHVSSKVKIKVNGHFVKQTMSTHNDLRNKGYRKTATSVPNSFQDIELTSENTNLNIEDLKKIFSVDKLTNYSLAELIVANRDKYVTEFNEGLINSVITKLNAKRDKENQPNNKPDKKYELGPECYEGGKLVQVPFGVWALSLYNNQNALTYLTGIMLKNDKGSFTADSIPGSSMSGSMNKESLKMDIAKSVVEIDGANYDIFVQVSDAFYGAIMSGHRLCPVGLSGFCVAYSEHGEWEEIEGAELDTLAQDAVGQMKLMLNLYPVKTAKKKASESNSDSEAA